jgi:hypothetical protein
VLKARADLCMRVCVRVCMCACVCVHVECACTCVHVECACRCESLCQDVHQHHRWHGSGTVMLYNPLHQDAVFQNIYTHAHYTHAHTHTQKMARLRLCHVIQPLHQDAVFHYIYTHAHTRTQKMARLRHCHIIQPPASRRGFSNYLHTRTHRRCHGSGTVMLFNPLHQDAIFKTFTHMRAHTQHCQACPQAHTVACTK